MSIREKLIAELSSESQKYDVCGIISDSKTIYPLGSDTKVLSTIFELFSRPVISRVAKEFGYEVEEPRQQNHYPDFTLHKKDSPNKKVAIDVKTTYVNKENEKFGFTLGGYTSFIRNETKNIVYPFSEYSDHLVIGYVYTRVAQRKSSLNVYTVDEIDEIPKPYRDVRVFLQDKWRMAGDSAGSGNTTNIGSIRGSYDDFVSGKSIFNSEEEFLGYWRDYEKTASLRNDKYKNVNEYRAWVANKSK